MIMEKHDTTYCPPSVWRELLKCLPSGLTSTLPEIGSSEWLGQGHLLRYSVIYGLGGAVRTLTLRLDIPISGTQDAVSSSSSHISPGEEAPTIERRKPTTVLIKPKTITMSETE